MLSSQFIDQSEKRITEQPMHDGIECKKMWLKKSIKVNTFAIPIYPLNNLATNLFSFKFWMFWKHLDWTDMTDIVHV